MVIEHWVNYLFPGSLYHPEEEAKKLKKRGVEAALKFLPKGAFGFELYDIEVRQGTLEDGQKITDRRQVRKSKISYPGGVVYDLGRAKAEVGSKSILVGNMECNGWKHVVKTCRGNFQPLDDLGQIIAAFAEIKRSKPK